MKKIEPRKIATLFRPETSTRVLCQVAMLIALAFVLERLVPVVNLLTMRISFAFIPMMFCAMLFGPVWGAIAFGIADILGWPIMGLTPIPLILLSRITQGFIYGLVLHRENLRFWPHSIINACATQIICSMGLTTLGLAQLTNSPYLPLLISRLPQVGVFVVLQIAAFPILLKLRDALRKAGHISINPESVYDSD